MLVVCGSATHKHILTYACHTHCDIVLLQSTDHSKRFTTPATFSHSHTHSYTDEPCMAPLTAHKEQYEI